MSGGGNDVSVASNKGDNRGPSKYSQPEPERTIVAHVNFVDYKVSTRKSGYNTYRGWTQIDYQNKHYNINQRDEVT